MTDADQTPTPERGTAIPDDEERAGSRRRHA